MQHKNNKLMDYNKEWLNWFENAENDYFEAGKILSLQLLSKYEIVCFHCQQCAEKMLKGYIAFNNGILQKTHDLVVLCETCTKYDSDFEKILGQCRDLTIYTPAVRQPNIIEIEPYQMKNAFNDATKIKNFIFSKLTNSKPC